MKAVIMAGGFGTRLRPLTINKPKPMVPIGNEPMMQHVIELLKRHNITKITSLLYFQPDIIKDYFGDGSAYGVEMDYALPDADLGTAGAVRHAVGNSDESVLVISGDLVTDFNLSEALEWHANVSSEATILLTRVENPLAYGIVITDANGRIERFLEKPSWGEAFSDTINTGIYILEPSAHQLIPENQNYDFSQNLYPLMLSRNMGLHGKIMDGYWKDVGNVEEYRLAHLDFYNDKIKLEHDGEKFSHQYGTLYKHADSEISEDVTIEGTVIVGKNVTIGPKSLLRNCTIGDNCIIGLGSKIKESTIWSDCQIGARSTLNSAIVCNRVILGDSVKLFDKVIISDDCRLDNDVVVKANCKIWPGKTVEEGAIVSSSLVWGEKWNRELFSDSKVTGLALTEITPEMCVRLGASFGATLGPGSKVVTCRDASDISRLLRRSFISGLLATGVDVLDLEAMPIPLVRYALSKGQYTAGMYMRHNPNNFRQLDIIIIDGQGLDMTTANQKKIERNYFGEDFERANLDNIGHLSTDQRVIEDYQEKFLSSIDVELIKNAGFKIVVDHGNGSSSQILPSILSRLGVHATELNASLNPRKFSTSSEEQAQSIVQLSAIVTSLNADLGVSLNPVAEKMTIVDERGNPIDNQLLLLLVTDLFLRTEKVNKIAVPISASMGVEKIAHEHNVEVIRVPNTHRDMMESHLHGEASYVGGTRGGFIFPGFQRGADAMIALAKILEMLAKTRTRFGGLRGLHENYVRESASVPCPWSKKGTVMRRLITESSEKERQLVDGVRIFEDNGWVLVAPDLMKASFNIVAESTSKNDVISLINQYSESVRSYQTD